MFFLTPKAMKCKIVPIIVMVILLCDCSSICVGQQKREKSGSGINARKTLKETFKATDIVFNELLADPLPAVDLPEVEYIELYNRMDQDVNLKNWMLYVGSKSVLLPSIVIKGNSFLILAKNTTYFEALGLNCLKLSLPTIANTSTQLVLLDDTKNCIDWMPFNNSDYPDSFKSDGGWSLERIDVHCLSYEDNWNWSESITGGSPGQMNSISESQIDMNGPHITSFEVVNQLIKIFFNERIAYLGQTLVFPNLSHEIISDPLQPNAISIEFTEGLDSNKTYQILNQHIQDLNKNQLINASFQFSLPKSPTWQDIIINELMPDPNADQTEYIELYNRTNRFLDISKVNIGKKTRGIIQSIYPISSLPQLMRPNSYLLICENLPDTVMYFDQIYETSKLQLTNDSGTVVVLNENGQIIDELSYQATMHAPQIKIEKGVALERINPDAPTNNASNWTSAAQSVNFCTPGKLNSQCVTENNSNERIRFSTDAISPNGDGADDFLIITVKTEAPSLITINIYDINGRQIQEIANNCLSGQQNFFKWDGYDSNHRKVDLGVYIVITQIYQHTKKSILNKTAIAVK